MDFTAPMTSLCLYKETRISLDPPTANSIVHLQLPGHGTFTRNTRVVRKVLDAVPASKSEDDFKKRHIASSSSIYFRSLKAYPRAILWRCLENSTVLELRSADCSKDAREQKEASLILRLGFPSQIQNGGVVLADHPGEDFVSVFVLTKGGDLYTFALRPIFFCRTAASEEDLEKWCKVFKPSSLAISQPHKIFAADSLELLISLNDGRLVRLLRKPGEDGSNWVEAAYNDGQWTSSLRSLVRWQANNTVRFEGNSLDQSTLVAASTTPDQQHIFAVALNHTLNVWNIATGKRTVSIDVLGVAREPQDIPKMMLDPAITRNLRVFESRSSGGYLYFALTYSPHSSGIFKFWGVRDADDEASGIRDLFPEDGLRLPDPDDGALWTLSDFDIKTAPDTTDVDIWILMRLNRRYKLYTRKFSELQTLHEDWATGWSIAAIDATRLEPSNEPPLQVSEFDHRDIPTCWIEYILSPGRVPIGVLDTALSVYAQTREMPLPKPSKTSLKQRILSCVGSQTTLQSPDLLSYDYAKFHSDLSSEWNSFWNIVTDIDQARWEPLSLSLDKYCDMAWISLSDGCSAIRDCSEVEILAHNKSKDLSSNPRAIMPSIEVDGSSGVPRASDELALLMDATAKFRAGFSESLKVSCEHAMLAELWTDPSYSIPTRIQNFYDSCNFESEVSDRQYNELSSSLKEIGGFEGLSTDALLATIESIPAPMSKSSKLTSTKFGLKALIAGAQDMIALHLRVLSDILFLLVFVDIEVDREEFAMRDFDAVSIYEPLLELLRQTQMARWLATKSRHDPHLITQNASTNGTSKSEKLVSSTSGAVTTVLENLFGRDIAPQSCKGQTQSLAFTYTIRDLLTWVAGGNQIPLDEVLVNIQCDLLKNNNLDLAISFQLFQPSSAWATYIRGRLCLLRHEYVEAAIYFKKAAFKLSRPIPPSSKYVESSCSFLDTVTASYLSTGLSNYYTHIITLFSTSRIHTQVVHFAQLALQQTPPSNSSARSDILARLFHASITLEDHSVAYSALTRYTDRALQKSALATLISSMASCGAVDTLLSFPFPTLHKDVDEWLVEKARAEANTPTASTATTGTVPYFKILYAWRLRQGDFRGAAAVLVERLEARRLLRKGAGGAVGRLAGAPKETEKALDEYLVAINALALVGGEGAADEGDEGWVFVEAKGGKRKVVRLSDLRSAYGEEMDRVGMLEMGRFGIVGDEEEEEGDTEMYD